MRIVSMIIGITFLFISVMPVTQAYAGHDMRMKNPCGKSMNPCGKSMNPCDKNGHMEKHMLKKKLKMRMKQLMEEGMDMWLETVQLVKESATKAWIKKKAADLEKRMRANITEHKGLHKKMHEMRMEHEKHHKKGGSMRGNPCGKMGM